MNQSTLLKLSLAISILGILFLFFIPSYLPAKQVSSYQKLTEGEHVTINSTVKSIRVYNNFKIIKLDNNITLTCFNCELSENQRINTKGRVVKYKNSLEIKVEKIENAP